jgi:nucleoside-diphosphate-sugar epimerase
MSLFLVTGGAGFIGSSIASELLRRGERVRILDDLSTGREENLRHVGPQAEVIRGSILDMETLRKAVQGTDYVLHQAALPSVQRSIEEPLEVDRVNVGGTLNVLVAARDARVKRVVYAASSSAYGDTPTLPKHEEMVPHPMSPYAASKLAGEAYITAFMASYGFEAVGLRYFNVFGPRQDPNSHYAAVIPRFVTRLLEGQAPIIYGDGTQSRDFCFIENVIDANLLACTASGVGGRVFNIAGGQRHDLLDLCRLIGKILGTDVAPRFEAPRAGDVKHSLADITRAQKSLGFQVKVSFEEGLRRTVAWYREQAGHAQGAAAARAR